MPDILNDVTSLFTNTVMPDLGNDGECHMHTKDALLVVNRFAFAERGAPGLTSRSIIEDGAIPDDLTDNRASIQATLDAVAAAGGGIALGPPAAPAGIFRWVGTITVPLAEMCNASFKGVRERILMKNIAYAGALAALLDFDTDVMRALLKEKFGKKPALMD